MSVATILGFPRIGPRRELKRALEEHWAGRLDETGLAGVTRSLRRDRLLMERGLGLDVVPVNDFSLYDHVLDTAVMVGAIPARYGPPPERPDLTTYFAMARGAPEHGGSPPRAAMEMTKWFDTNYHYLVPEFEAGQRFRPLPSKPIEELGEARGLGVPARPVILGPLSFLLLGKPADPAVQPLRLLEPLLEAYAEILRRLERAGADWVQIDEPCLALDLPPGAAGALEAGLTRLAAAAPGTRLLLATYFGGLAENLEAALRLPITALHLDLVRAPEQLEPALAAAPRGLSLSLGVVDGRNIWRADLDRALAPIERAAAVLGPERVVVAPSCSLLHVPIDLGLEEGLDAEIRSWLAFAKEKIGEVVLLARAVREGRVAVAPQLSEAREALSRRRASPRLGDPEVRRRLAAATPDMLRRGRPFAGRRPLQRAALGLPRFPTTTIGSFPQTPQVRRARAEARAGRMTPDAYDAFLERETERAIRFQEEIGLDLLVHGEFERNDMVEHFGERLRGFAFTAHGWVQSYGSRCVKPPILYGDVSRPGPMTVRWSRYARSLTPKPMKGMLTGPSTILQWSFVRDDQPRAETRRQIALALRDEVADLEAAGLGAIQIDEPALREGLPLRRADRHAYLEEAVAAFRLASCAVRDETQIHTHMCYGEFGDILEAIAALDADVISIEASRSRMDLLDAFGRHRYPNDVGPGVYDIHSPRVPAAAEIEALLRRALRVLETDQLWVNPDCGLKTRRWEEVRPALAALVAAARALRADAEIAGGPERAGS